MTVDALFIELINAGSRISLGNAGLEIDAPTPVLERLGEIIEAI